MVHDALGNVVGLTDAGDPQANPVVPGQLVERYDYDPYGTPYVESWDSVTQAFVRQSDASSSYGNPFLWTGQRWDASVRLYHFWARSYSPHLGRWLQRDPLGLRGGLNVYECVRWAPTVFVEPLGLMSPGGYPPYAPFPGGDNDDGGDDGGSGDEGRPEAAPCGDAGVPGWGIDITQISGGARLMQIIFHPLGFRYVKGEFFDAAWTGLRFNRWWWTHIVWNWKGRGAAWITESIWQWVMNMLHIRWPLVNGLRLGSAVFRTYPKTSLSSNIVHPR